MKKILVLALVLAVMAIVVAPMAALADTTGSGTTNVDGTMAGPVLTFSAPGAFSFGTFIPGWNGPTSGALGSVTFTPGSDGNLGWTVTAQDVAASSGYMFKDYVLDGTGTHLTNQMYMTLVDNESSSGPATANTLLSVSNTNTSDAIRLDAQQQIVSTDTTAGTYWIVITFNASCVI